MLAPFLVTLQMDTAEDRAQGVNYVDALDTYATVEETVTEDEEIVTTLKQSDVLIKMTINDTPMVKLLLANPKVDRVVFENDSYVIIRKTGGLLRSPHQLICRST